MATSNGFNLVGADCAFSSIGDQTVADTAHAIGIRVRSPTTVDPTFTMALFARSRAKDPIPIRIR